MNAITQIKYSDLNDQGLIDLFNQRKDRQAIRELYARYHASVWRFLQREVKDQATISDLYNTILLRLISEPASHHSDNNVSTRLFALAHQLRLNYALDQRRTNAANGEGAARQQNTVADDPLSTLPRQHRDVLELVYQFNFSFDETASILGCSTSSVRDRWSEARTTPALTQNQAALH